MPEATTILVVDDELQIRLLLRRALERAGYRVIEAADGQHALLALAAHRPAVVLLDLGLPDRDGLELVPAIKQAQAGLLIISAREGIADKVAALDLGADDYVTKPFDTQELAARVRAALRHRAGVRPDEPTITCGALTVDLANRRVFMHGVEVHLAPKEYAVLAQLAHSAGKVITHSQLLRAIWGPAHAGNIEYLRVTVRAIRRKLGEEPETSVIRNEPAVGYRLILPG